MAVVLKKLKQTVSNKTLTNRSQLLCTNENLSTVIDKFSHYLCLTARFRCVTNLTAYTY